MGFNSVFKGLIVPPGLTLQSIRSIHLPHLYIPNDSHKNTHYFPMQYTLTVLSYEIPVLSER